MTNAQVGMIAGAIVIAGAFVGFGLSGARKGPAPKDRAEGTVEFIETVAENFHTVTDAVKVEMVRASLQMIAREVEIYAERNENQYPDSLDAVAGLNVGNVDADPRDLWGRRYHYSLKKDSSGGIPYDLHSAGPDGQDGTPDDIFVHTSD